MNRPTFVVADNTYKRTTILIQNRTEAVNCGGCRKRQPTNSGGGRLPGRECGQLGQQSRTQVGTNGRRSLPAVGGTRGDDQFRANATRLWRFAQFTTSSGGQLRRWETIWKRVWVGPRAEKRWECELNREQRSGLNRDFSHEGQRSAAESRFQDFDSRHLRWAGTTGMEEAKSRFRAWNWGCHGRGFRLCKWEDSNYANGQAHLWACQVGLLSWVAGVDSPLTWRMPRQPGQKLSAPRG
ncbi:hypothetical protein Fot_03638 [Forsythia ovata]|uniref:Uncharacterized protein n=1 Tax=Forsythia ovata TaxID=205694 RepID=A0ABD1XA98_9LAMI